MKKHNDGLLLSLLTIMLLSFACNNSADEQANEDLQPANKSSKNDTLTEEQNIFLKML
jgi:hypothetical protein